MIRRNPPPLLFHLLRRRSLPRRPPDLLPAPISPYGRRGGGSATHHTPFLQLQTVCPAAMTHRSRGSPWTSNGWLSSSYSTLPHTGRTRPPGPHPVPCISIITHAHTRWSRYHQARLPPLHHGPGSRSCLGLSPRPTRKAQSRPLRTSRRLAGFTRTAQRDALLSRHDNLRPPASSGCTSRTNHDSTQPTCAQWSWSRSSRTGVAGPAPGPTAADPSGATRLTLPPHHHSSCDRDKHTPRPPAASARFALLNHSHARPRHRNGPTPKGANDLSLLGHHSLGSVVDPPLQGHHALTHRGILRCSVQIRCQTNYISPSMRSQQVQVGPGR